MNENTVARRRFAIGDKVAFRVSPTQVGDVQVQPGDLALALNNETPDGYLSVQFLPADNRPSVKATLPFDHFDFVCEAEPTE